MIFSSYTAMYICIVLHHCNTFYSSAFLFLLFQFAFCCFCGLFVVAVGPCKIDSHLNFQIILKNTKSQMLSQISELSLDTPVKCVHVSVRFILKAHFPAFLCILYQLQHKAYFPDSLKSLWCDSASLIVVPLETWLPWQLTDFGSLCRIIVRHLLSFHNGFSQSKKMQLILFLK